MDFLTYDWITVTALVVAYFFPTLLAAMRHVKAGAGVLILNALLGWTFLGWVGALIWAAVGAPEED